MFDTALAVQNMVLAAHALGLGTVIIGAFDAAKAEKVLGVPKGYRIVTVLPGRRAGQGGQSPAPQRTGRDCYQGQIREIAPAIVPG